MSKRYDCRDPQERTAGIDAAVTAARAGELIVLPTDTVYGIGADAFIPAAVTTMLAAKGRGRNMPPPVLVGTARAAAALVDEPDALDGPVRETASLRATRSPVARDARADQVPKAAQALIRRRRRNPALSFGTVRRSGSIPRRARISSASWT